MCHCSTCSFANIYILYLPFFAPVESLVSFISDTLVLLKIKTDFEQWQATYNCQPWLHSPVWGNEALQSYGQGKLFIKLLLCTYVCNLPCPCIGTTFTVHCVYFASAKVWYIRCTWPFFLSRANQSLRKLDRINQMSKCQNNQMKFGVWTLLPQSPLTLR